MSVKQPQPDPLEAGKGRIDEVDQSKGVFPPGVPHPPGAEPRMPGSMGGGSYEESGRGSIELPSGAVTPREPVVERGDQPEADVDEEEQGEAEQTTESESPGKRDKP